MMKVHLGGGLALHGAVQASLCKSRRWKIVDVAASPSDPDQRLRGLIRDVLEDNNMPVMKTVALLSETSSIPPISHVASTALSPRS